jgi:predicted amidohydrolase
MLRVAALQYATTTDVDQNLATCLRMIDEAARQYQPELMVLSEFSNHLSWYDDREHALRVAVTLEGPFLEAIAARARSHAAHIVINCSLRRGEDALTVTSLLYGPEGTLLAEADKQTLMGHENVWFAPAEKVSPVIETSKARLGLYPCRDGVTMETPRCLALRGAQIACNSLNSFALDEASLHVPARAPENRMFVVAANKIGPLIPLDKLELASQATFIPVPFLYGAGESQIVAPDGRVLAKGPRGEEAIVFAEIDPSEADEKCRPDGTHRFNARRPDLYRPIGFKPRERPASPASDELEVACVSLLDEQTPDEAIAAARAQVEALARDGAKLIVLPELFCFRGARVDDPLSASEWFVPAVRALAEACAETAAHVVTSLVERIEDDFMHTGLVIGPAGIVARQAQLHVPDRHAWATRGRKLDVVTLPWGKLAVVVGDDMVFPETAKLCALLGAHVLAVPFDVQESWETALGLRSRAAENRLCIAAATRPKEHGTSTLLDLEREFTIMQPWSERVFDGRISDPIVLSSLHEQVVLRGCLHPDAANNKVMSQDTHLLDKRPWWLVGDLTRQHTFSRADSSESADQARAPFSDDPPTLILQYPEPSAIAPSSPVEAESQSEGVPSGEGVPSEGVPSEVAPSEAVPSEAVHVSSSEPGPAISALADEAATEEDPARVD